MKVVESKDSKSLERTTLMATQGGTHEQHQKAGHAGGVATAEHRSQGSNNSSPIQDTVNQSTGIRGGTPEQHAKAGSQSHKNTK
jgi:hypothetical protein